MFAGLFEVRRDWTVGPLWFRRGVEPFSFWWARRIVPVTGIVLVCWPEMDLCLRTAREREWVALLGQGGKEQFVSA